MAFGWALVFNGTEALAGACAALSYLHTRHRCNPAEEDRTTAKPRLSEPFAVSVPCGASQTHVLPWAVTLPQTWMA